jgi:hypothetical protein
VRREKVAKLAALLDVDTRTVRGIKAEHVEEVGSRERPRLSVQVAPGVRALLPMQSEAAKLALELVRERSS